MTGSILIEELYDIHAPRLLNYARKYINDHHLAEDVLQETLIRAWRHSEHLTPERGSIGAWLTRVAHNVAIDKVRMNSRAATTTVDLQSDPGVPVTDHAESVATAISVREAFAKLGPLHRRVIYEVFYRDRSLADVAAELDVPIGTVKSRLHYALRRLRVLISGGDWTPV